MNYAAASSGVSDSLDSGFRRNDELAASGGEYNPKKFKGFGERYVFLQAEGEKFAKVKEGEEENEQ